MSSKMVDNPNGSKVVAAPKDPEDNLDSLAIAGSEDSQPNANSNNASSDELPEKYKGKSPAEIARMHQELESRFGQQGNEVGELRKTLDTYIHSRLQDGTQQQVEETPEVDFFDDPKVATANAIKNSPEMQQLLEASRRQEQQSIQQQLTRKHPDYESTLNNAEFQGWVKESKLRQRLLMQADRNYDIEAADDLFSEWGRIQNANKTNSDAVISNEQVQRKQDIKKASTGTAKGNPSGKGGRKIFRRADIVELMKTNPRRYESLAAEIRQAYAEGRVK